MSAPGTAARRTTSNAGSSPGWTIAAVVAFVYLALLGGGALSGVLSGRGPVLPEGRRVWMRVPLDVLRHAGDPALAWPESNRPGGPVLTWVSIAVVAAALTAAWLRAARWRTRSRARSRSGEGGFADHRELSERGLTEKAAVAKVARTRASLANTPVKKIDSVRETTRLGVLYDDHSTALHIQYRDCILVQGPTGAGKTWRVVVSAVLGATGSVVTTSTRGDVLRATWAERSRLGRCEVFDPDGLTAWPTSMPFSILAGCEDPEVALRRGAALVQAVPSDDVKNASYWSGKAAMLMRGYLYAAAVLGEDLHTVRTWSASRNVKPVRDVLRRDLPGWYADLSQALDSKSDSADDVISACTRLLEPLASPRMMRSLNVPPEYSTDLTELLTSGRNTVYLVSEGGSASASAFTTLLSAELYHAARTAGLANDDDALDPPLRMVLDEMNNIAAIPDMPSLITDSGARGIQICAVVHSDLQNQERWGRIGGERLSTEAPVRMYLPGLGDEGTLASLSRLLGTRDDHYSQNAPPRTVPVMSGDEIRRMREDQALVVMRGASPIKLHLPSVWDVPEQAQRIRANQKQFDEFLRTAKVVR